MAINMHCSFINNTGLNENNCLKSLLDNVSPEFDNECDIISRSKYCSDVDFQGILQAANCDICIVKLPKFKTRFELLKLFVADTDKLSQISCITLQGTCFDEHTDLALPLNTWIYLDIGYLPYKLTLWCSNIF